jgi:hypothetical protein
MKVLGIGLGHLSSLPSPPHRESSCPRPCVIHKHRKVPLSPASGERVQDDTHKEGAYEVLRKGIEGAG